MLDAIRPSLRFDGIPGQRLQPTDQSGQFRVPFDHLVGELVQPSPDLVQPSLVVRTRQLPDDQVGSDGEISACSGMLDRAVDGTGCRPPPSGAQVVLPNGVGFESAGLVEEHLSEQRVVAEPRPAAVEWRDEQAGTHQRLQHRC